MTAASSWELDPEHEEFRPPAALLNEMASAGLLGLSIPEEDGGTVRQEVNHGVTSQLGGYARLGAVYLTSALPKTRTGKTMRRLLRDVVEHGGPRGDTSAMEDTAGLQAVRQAVAADVPRGA